MPVETVWAVEPQGVKPLRWRASVEAWSNMASHASILRSSAGALLVLEDDADVPQDFGLLIDEVVSQLPPNWESIWLGGQHLLAPRTISTGIVQNRHPIRTHAYIVRGPAISAALHVATHAVDHWDVPLGQVLARRGTSFSPDPFLVGTTGLPGDIPDSLPLERIDP